MSSNEDNIFQNLPGPKRASKWRLIRFWLIVGSAIGLGVVAVVVLMLANAYGEKLTAIRVTYVGKGEEMRDAKIPLRDHKEQLPDYRLEVICETDGVFITERKYEFGPIPDRSAEEPLEFTFAADVSRDKVLQINLFESDPLEDDVVTSVQVSEKAEEEADEYRFELVTQKSLRFGFERIWEGKFGAAVVIMLLSMAFAMVLGLGELILELFITAISTPVKRGKP
jgi:hypothetical protein